MRAKCFIEEDKKLLVERVRSNQTGVQNRKFRKEQVIEGLLDRQTWCCCLIAICTTLPTSGPGAFANTIITGFNFTVLQTQLLAMVLGFCIIIVPLSSIWVATKTHQKSHRHWRLRHPVRPPSPTLPQLQVSKLMDHADRPPAPSAHSSAQWSS